VRELNIVTFTQTRSMHQHHQTINNHKQSPPMLVINRTGESNKGRVACYLTRQSSFVMFIRRNLSYCGGKAVADKIWIAGAIQGLCGHRQLSGRWGAVAAVRSWGESDAASLDKGSNSSHRWRKREGAATHRKRRSLCSRTSWLQKKLLMTFEFNFRFKIIMYIS